MVGCSQQPTIEKEVIVKIVNQSGLQSQSSAILSSPFVQQSDASHAAYAANYISSALTSDKLDIPDKQQANGTSEVLTSLYDAHKAGGIAGARTAWEMIKKLRPDIAHLEINGHMLIHASELKLLSKPEVQLDGYPFYRYAFNLLIGQSGTGKSFVALDYGGRVAQQRPVVYIVGEGLHGYAARWEAWKNFTQGEDAFMYFHKEPVQIHDPAQLQTFTELVRPKTPELIIVDTFARCAVGLEENSARDVGLWVDALDHMRRDLSCGVLVVHHTGKDGKIRGSSALYGAADAVLMQTKVDGRIALINNADAGGKNKHDQESATRYIRIVPWEVGEYAGAVLMEDQRVMKESPREKLSPNHRTILEALDGYDKGMSPKNIMEATSIGSSSMFSALKSLLKANYVQQNEDERYIITEEGRDALSF